RNEEVRPRLRSVIIPAPLLTRCSSWPRRLVEHDQPVGHRRRRLGRLTGKESGAIVRTIATSARLVRSLTVATLLLAACDQSPKPPADPYDPGKMDLKPGPARLSAESQQGAFAEANELSLSVVLKHMA